MSVDIATEAAGILAPRSCCANVLPRPTAVGSGAKQAPCREAEAKRAGKQAQGPVIVELSDVEAQHMANLAELVDADPLADRESWLEQARSQSGLLPDSVLEAFAGLQYGGAVLVRGCPVGQLPPTPTDNVAGLARYTFLAREQAIMAALLGDLVSYEAEGHGHTFQDMVPNPHQAFTQSSLGSEVELESHVEQAFSLRKPDYLTLGALRGDRAAKTYLFSVAEMIDHLTNDEVARLREPRWTFEIDASFRAAMPNPREIRGPWPILSGDPSDPHGMTLNVDFDMGWGISREDQALLERLVPIYREHRTALVLRASDILTFCNRTNMHGRSPFLARYDGRDRWISRGFIVRDLAATADVRPAGDRVIAARFS